MKGSSSGDLDFHIRALSRSLMEGHPDATVRVTLRRSPRRGSAIGVILCILVLVSTFIVGSRQLASNDQSAPVASADSEPESPLGVVCPDGKGMFVLSALGLPEVEDPIELPALARTLAGIQDLPESGYTVRPGQSTAEVLVVHLSDEGDIDAQIVATQSAEGLWGGGRIVGCS